MFNRHSLTSCKSWHEKPAVVQIDVETDHGFKSGTGFFITPGGFLVTNAHVIAGALTKKYIMATENDGTHYFVDKIAYLDRDADIAILKFDCGDVAYLEPDHYNDVAEGQTILVIGNPEGLQGTVSNGLVSAIREDQNRISNYGADFAGLERLPCFKRRRSRNWRCCRSPWGSSLRPPISFYGPNIVFNGRRLSHQAMAQQIQSAFAQWPQRALNLVSGPTVVGPSHNQEGSGVRYEIAFMFRNEQRHFEGKAAIQLRVEIQGDQFAITSISSRILEQN